MHALKLILITFMISGTLNAQINKSYEIKSPDGKISFKIESGSMLRWSVFFEKQQILAPSEIGLQLENGVILGENAKIISTKTENVNTSFAAINYKRLKITDNYNQLIINCKGDFGLIIRAYNDGVAYRFFTKLKGEIIIKNEITNFNFNKNHNSFIPIMWDYRDNQKFNHSFEALYRQISFSEFPKDSLAFLPLVVELENNKKAAILEADLEDYPGMYLDVNQNKDGFIGVFSPYPLQVQMGGYENMNYVPSKRADYIAKTKGTRNFPWRALVISSQDKELLDNNMVQKLASPSRISDVSWIEPGQSAWDWWNNWNITHVDFKAGMNTETYKAYIDFAASNHLKFIIIDWGWSSKTDLSIIIPEMDIKEIVDYGKLKGVGVFLWASWHAVAQQMDSIFPLYSKMGIKGFKIDFVDRDDQLAVASTYDIAEKAAKYKLMVDYHGIFKPTGLQRTYPNVIGYEGVKGLENVKWAIEDAPRYAVSIPFIRMLAGPMDYTPGAMRNSNKANFHPVNDMPMSQGTRCQQMAMYVVYESPFQILSDNPGIYTKEQECTDFITKVPTTTDETVALDGEIGKYCVIARKKGDAWFIGAMTNWDEREITIDFSFTGKGKYKAEIFRDGINADKDATDYKKEFLEIESGSKLTIHLAKGGGWVARIEKEE